MRGNWSDLKESVKPGNIAKDAVSRAIRNQTRETLSSNNIIKGVLSIGAAWLVKRFVNKAGKRLGQFFRK